jgi:hypothetical protein
MSACFECHVAYGPPKPSTCAKCGIDHPEVNDDVRHATTILWMEQLDLLDWRDDKCD